MIAAPNLPDKRDWTAADMAARPEDPHREVIDSRLPEADTRGLHRRSQGTAGARPAVIR